MKIDQPASQPASQPSWHLQIQVRVIRSASLASDFYMDLAHVFMVVADCFLVVSRLVVVSNSSGTKFCPENRSQISNLCIMDPFCDQNVFLYIFTRSLGPGVDPRQHLGMGPWTEPWVGLRGRSGPYLGHVVMGPTPVSHGRGHWIDPGAGSWAGPWTDPGSGSWAGLGHAGVLVQTLD